MKAATPAPVVHWRERRLSAEKVDLLKRTVAKGTDNDQFELFLSVCQRHGLDPFVKQVYCVLWPVTKHHQDEKGIWLPGHEMVIITGIGGYRKMAARDHRDYAGSSDATFTWFEPPKVTPAGRRIPESATVRVHRRGAEDTVATVYWEELAPFDLNDKRADFWNRMPKNQLEKCAEAKGLRKAFPGLGDVFTEEEMSQRMLDLTEGGREIVMEGGTAPSGRQVTYQHGREAARSVLEDKLAGRMPLNPTGQPIDVPAQPASQQPSNRKASRKIPDSDYRKENVPAATAVPPLQFKGTVQIDYTNEKWPIVRGDLAEILDALKAACPNMDWGKDSWWHVLPRELEALKVTCASLGYRVDEVFPKSSGGPAGRDAGTSRGSGGGAHPHASPSAAVKDSTLVTGLIDQISEKMTKGSPPTEKSKGRASAPYLSILLQTADRKKTFYSCFDHDMFPYLQRAKAKQELCRVLVKKSGQYSNIVGLKNVGTTEFDDDGKTVVVQQKDREAGQRTLY